MPKPNKPMKLETVYDRAVDFDQLSELKKKVIGETLARMLMRRKGRNDHQADGQADSHSQS